MAENFEELESSVGVPAFILERSAAARATAAGSTPEAVIADWTGGEAPAAVPGDAGGEPIAEAAAAEATSGAAAASVADTPGLPTAESLTGEALISAAAEAKGIPVSLVERSAQARADADGVPADQVMRQWAVEGGVATAAAAAAPPSAPAESAAAPVESAAPPVEPVSAPVEPTAAPTESAAPAVEVLMASEPIEEGSIEPAPSRTGRYPAWLAASLVIIPLLAVLYVVVVPNQPSCGSAGQVGIDPVTGAHANCDGSVPYGAVQETNVLLGGLIYQATCAVCHGAAGEGGAGPGLAGGVVLETFPQGACDLHQEWVTLGSAGWLPTTYGAQDKPVQGGMPPAGVTLTEEEIARVVLYERVALGGADEATAEADCGFNEDGEFEVTAAG